MNVDTYFYLMNVDTYFYLTICSRTIFSCSSNDWSRSERSQDCFVSRFPCSGVCAIADSSYRQEPQRL